MPCGFGTGACFTALRSGMNRESRALPARMGLDSSTLANEGAVFALLPLFFLPILQLMKL